ncbi:hypothetical protein [Salinicola socius]|uniref:Uncharacterized protein n=1 Tax=Salinicola socius TaxID=404433 RepID=A0A1Q8SV76_9GAMM|nr:hypothetical protein [Salinicola socius]OLO05306.1 hypothetical protein BTW07_04560 [Salinicola socius]
MTENRKAKRPSIYLSPPLQQVADNLRNGQSLSQRLATVAERYRLVCSNVPTLTENERVIVGSTLSGSHVEPLLIKHLDDEIEDSDAGDLTERRDLAARVRDMTLAERVALIESLGY